MLALGYLAAILMGVTLGLIGGGGSILTVPILVYLIGLEPVLASGYSLFVVGAAALVGSVAYVRRRLVDWPTVVVFGLPSIAAVYLVRREIMPRLPAVVWSGGGFELSRGGLVLVVFALFMLLTSVSMIRDPRSGEADRGEDRGRRINGFWLAGVEGCVVGAVTGFVGAGGGFLIVPSLVFLVGLPMREAIGTSLAIIALKSLVGFLGELHSPERIDWPLLIAFTAFATGGIVLGVEGNRRVPAGRLRPIFGWFVLLMAIGILVRESLF